MIAGPCLCKEPKICKWEQRSTEVWLENEGSLEVKWSIPVKVQGMANEFL